MERNEEILQLARRVTRLELQLSVQQGGAKQCDCGETYRGPTKTCPRCVLEMAQARRMSR